MALCVYVCMCVAGNRRLHSLICSFLFSRCSFCLFFFFLTIRLSQLLNTKHECGENHLSSFFCDIDFFPFIRDSPVFSCRFKLLGNDFFFFLLLFQNDLLKYEHQFLVCSIEVHRVIHRTVRTFCSLDTALFLALTFLFV